MSLVQVLQRLLAVAGIGACLAATPALATDLPPGSTLDPVPVVALPAGAVLENTYSRDYDVSWTAGLPPLPRHMTGTISQNVYRMPDNTLIFRYYVSNDSTSQGAITRIAASNFGDFSTDVSLASGLICFNCENADRATRDIFGSGVAFEYDNTLSSQDFFDFLTAFFAGCP